MAGETLITGARVLAPDMSGAPHRDVLVSAGTIAAVAAPGSIAAEGRRVIDATDRMLVPGLVNAHTHSHGALGRGLVGDRVPLEVFLTEGAAGNAGRTLADKVLSARLGAVELIRKGCTACFDLFTEVPAPSVAAIHAVAGAYAGVGMRAVVAPMIATRTIWQALPGLLESLPADAADKVRAFAAAPQEVALAVTRAAIETWPHDRAMVRPAVAPTIPLHCDDAFMVAAARLAEEHDVPFQTHLAETETQATLGHVRYGRSLVAHLEALGVLSPRFSAAHAIWIGEEDMARLAAAGAGVSHNPLSNLRLGSGVAPVRAMLEAGVRLGIGTDASNTSDGQNMFEAARLGAYLSRIAARDPSAWLSAEEAFAAATTGSAALMGFAGLGRLAEGAAADIVFLDLAVSHYVPLREPLRQLVFGETGAAVASVMIAGEMVLEEGRMLTLDEAALRAEAEEAAARLDAANAGGIAGAEVLSTFVGCFCLGQAPNPEDLARRLAEGVGEGKESAGAAFLSSAKRAK